MKKNSFASVRILGLALMIVSLAACSPSATNSDQNDTADSIAADSISVQNGNPDSLNQNIEVSETGRSNAQSIILVYNFHVTNRCASCIAIEDGTTKTLNTYFSKEMKEGRIKRYIVNVDEDANAKIAEKYQVFGSGLFVTRVLNGKESTTDLTGDGFKYARSKEEKFIEILKSTITEYLK